MLTSGDLWQLGNSVLLNPCLVINRNALKNCWRNTSFWGIKSCITSTWLRERSLAFCCVMIGMHRPSVTPQATYSGPATRTPWENHYHVSWSSASVTEAACPSASCWYCSVAIILFKNLFLTFRRNCSHPGRIVGTFVVPRYFWVTWFWCLSKRLIAGVWVAANCGLPSCSPLPPEELTDLIYEASGQDISIAVLTQVCSMCKKVSSSCAQCGTSVCSVTGRAKMSHSKWVPLWICHYRK